ncbi:MAG: DNA polymerase I, partial [Clostridia bacterium]|nr:DNA polymerase I [Clostridia bacterium]
ERGIDLDVPCDDVMIMGYVLSASENDYSLKKLVSRTLIKDVDGGADLAKYIVHLYRVYSERLGDAERRLYKDIELPLCDVLFDMEKYGFLVDVGELVKFSERLGAMQREYEQRIYMQAGEEFNINSTKQLGAVLFEKMGFPSGKKTKTGYSTSAEVLERLRPYGDIIDDILEYRQVGKLKSTYADGLTRAADENGRVHTSFRQALTATGRLSSTEPNLQNIPIKTELGREFRRYFTSAEGYTLIDADYSQIELRLLAAISGDENMIDAFKSGYDIHTATAMRVFGVSAEQVTVPLRKRAKAINFGIVYGMGDFSLATDLHISKREAADYIESYFRTYPGVRAYLDDIVRKAHEDKFVTTLFGRKRYIPEISSTRKQEQAFGERVAMNSPIQGTAADIIKLAMVNISKKLKEAEVDARLVLQVHDELIIEAKDDCAEKVREMLKKEMENAVSLPVPLTVEISTGKTWYDAK